MAKRFEEIEVWQLARALVKDIYELSFQENIRRNYSLTDQIQRAALSVMNNIAEGYERQSTKELTYMLNIAKGSSGEVRSITYVLLDLKLIDEQTFSDLLKRTTTISKSLAGFITYLRGRSK
jgi:four helix bundle protein